MYSIAILTISDKYAKGEKEDKSGKIIRDVIASLPANVAQYEVITQDREIVTKKLIEYCDSLEVDLVLTSGGTGFAARDVTPECTKQIIEKETPGIAEAMRVLCLPITKKAMLSRGVAGIRGKTLIINLPGSSKGVQQSLEAIMDVLPRGLDMISGKRK